VSRLVKKPWWLALAVTAGVAILPGAAQALPMSYEYYRGDFGAGAMRSHKGILAEPGTDLSGWAPAKVDVNSLRSVDYRGTIVSALYYGDAAVFDLDEGSPTMDGPALVAPGHYQFEAQSGGQYEVAGDCDPTGAVPEPETVVLMGLGLLGIAAVTKALG